MASKTSVLGMAVVLAALNFGCDAVDYYPHHDLAEHPNDLRKDGPGDYGGTNGNYPVSTPGTARLTQSSDARLHQPTSDSGATTFSTNGTAVASQITSYSGAAVGGGLSNSTTPADGTTHLGTATGR